MSWMGSWSRPSKHAATPPPLYLTSSDPVPYCHSCGRVISHRKSASKTTSSSSSQPIKYCSTRCRNRKPGLVDRRIESVFAQLLNGATAESLAQDAEGLVKEKPKDKGHKTRKSKTVKGDPRIIVECETVQFIIFPHEKDPEKIYGRKKNRAARGIVEKPEEWRSVDMVSDPETESTAVPIAGEASGASDQAASDSDEHGHAQGGVELEPEDDAVHAEDDAVHGYGGGKIQPPQSKSDVNGSVGGEKGWAERNEETDGMKLKRREGQRRAEEREMVRRAARRGCAFGFVVDWETEEKRECEAVMKGVAVEASFAKGEWGIRWREKS